MKSINLAKIRKEMEKTLEPKRYEHTLSVAYTAANLAIVHGADVDAALTAGMLHDCAKCLGYKKQLSICKKRHIQLSEFEKKECSPILHAKAGAVLAKEKYGIESEDILNAIFYHTTGRPQMSMLEKIIYIADYIEPGRRHVKGTVLQAEDDKLTRARRMAYKDLDEALIMILQDTLSYLETKGGRIDPMTRETYEYYRKGNTAHEQ